MVNKKLLLIMLLAAASITLSARRYNPFAEFDITGEFAVVSWLYNQSENENIITIRECENVQDYTLRGLYLTYYSLRHVQIREHRYLESNFVPVLLAMVKWEEDNHKKIVIKSTYRTDCDEVSVMALLKEYTYQYDAKNYQEIAQWWQSCGSKTDRKKWAEEAFDKIIKNFSNEKRIYLAKITRNFMMTFMTTDYIEAWWKEHRNDSYNRWLDLAFDEYIENIEQPDQIIGYTSRISLFVMLNDDTKEQLGIPLRLPPLTPQEDKTMFLAAYKKKLIEWRNSIKSVSSVVPFEFFWEYDKGVPGKFLTPTPSPHIKAVLRAGQVF